MDDRIYDYDGGGTRKSIMRIIPPTTTTSRPEDAQKLQEKLCQESMSPDSNISNSTVVFEEDGPSNEIGGAIRLITNSRSDTITRQSSSSQYCRGAEKSNWSGVPKSASVGKLGTIPILMGKTIGKVGSRDGLIDLTV